MILDLWAIKWGVSTNALHDLRMMMGVDTNGARSATTEDGSESRQQSIVRMDAARHGVWLTRNNVGVLRDERGVPVRYGLANESKAQNMAVKSADLIGIKPVLIGSHHIGQVIGQFVSREVKWAGWQWKGDSHEQAQLAWCNFILSKGGDAAFATGEGSFGNA